MTVVLDSEVSHEESRTFFREKEECIELLLRLSRLLKEDPEDRQALDAISLRISTILDLYQEFPHLLDRHLEEMMGNLMSMANYGLKDPNFLHRYSMNIVFRSLYLLCKVRGAKILLRFFDHEPRHLDAVMKALGSLDRNQTDQWEIRYGLLLWLSLLSQIPFDLEKTFEKGIIEKLIMMSQAYLGSAGKEKEAAASVLAKVLMRADSLREGHLQRYLIWAISYLTNPSSCLSVKIRPPPIFIDDY